MTVAERTLRWNGAVVASLAVSIAGIYFNRPSLLLVSIVGVAFAAYPHVVQPPPTDFNVKRTVSTRTPSHGHSVTVTVTVTNESSRYVPLVTIEDGVPPMLIVSSGTAHHATTLSPDESATFRYEVTARHGRHAFEPSELTAFSFGNSIRCETTVSTDTEIVCLPVVERVPLPRQSRGVGITASNATGDGVQFHQTRTYRSGDPVNRIDWRRFARTGTLTTVEYRESQSGSVVLCVDARRAAYCQSAADEPHAVWYSVSAAEAILDALAQSGTQIGLAVIGRQFCWVPPGTGSRAVIGSMLNRHPVLAVEPPTDETDHHRQVAKLAATVQPNDQLIILSPLVDSFIVETIARLHRDELRAVVVSPNVTTEKTTGGQVERLHRSNRIHALRRLGVSVADWNPDEPLNTALDRMERRWQS